MPKNTRAADTEGDTTSDVTAFLERADQFRHNAVQATGAGRFHKNNVTTPEKSGQFQPQFAQILMTDETRPLSPNFSHI